MTTTKQDVLHVAKLARLQLTEREIEPLVRELNEILHYVAQLDELDTRDVPPTAHVAVLAAPLRADERREGLSNELALGQAPRTGEGGFAVPGFVEES